MYQGLTASVNQAGRSDIIASNAVDNMALIQILLAVVAMYPTRTWTMPRLRLLGVTPVLTLASSMRLVVPTKQRQWQQRELDVSVCTRLGKEIGQIVFYQWSWTRCVALRLAKGHALTLPDGHVGHITRQKCEVWLSIHLTPADRALCVRVITSKRSHEEQLLRCLKSTRLLDFDSDRSGARGGILGARGPINVLSTAHLIPVC